MRLVLSILCILAVTWAQIAVYAQVPQVASAKADCGCGGKMPCCNAQPVQTPPPLSANPTPAGSQNQFSVPLQIDATWILHDAGLPRFPHIVSTLRSSRGTALYARDCARLI